MKKILNAALLALAIMFAPGGAQAEPVYVKNCSGVYLDKGYVLTAGHCLDQEDIFVAKANPENKATENVERFTAKIVWSTASRDFGLLQLDKALVKRSKAERDDAPDEDGKYKKADISQIPFAPTKAACTYPNIGDKLTVRGWPAGQYVEYEATISSKHGEHFYWPVSNLAASPSFYGASGSGAYNSHAEVSSIVVGSIRGSGLAVLIPVAEICNILPRELQ